MCCRSSFALMILSGAAMVAAFGPNPVMKPGTVRPLLGNFMGRCHRQPVVGERIGRCRGLSTISMVARVDTPYTGIRQKSGVGQKVLVAGGAGYIGSHVCTDLLMNGYEVIVLDNFMNSSPASIKRVEMLTGKRITAYEADTRDYSALVRIFESEARTKPIDSVVHLAGLKAVGESVAKPHLYYDNNVVGSINLVRAMAEVGCKNLVFSSSATVYGDVRSCPIKETHPLSATSPYGRSKLYIEEMLRDTCAADKEWSIAILRYFNPVGAHPSGMIGEDPKGVPNNLMPFITKVALGKQPLLQVFGNDYPTKDGTGVRDYLHICDLSSGHLAALEKLKEFKGSDVFNLGTGKGISVLEMVGEFKQASGAQVPYKIVERRSGDVAICYADPSKAKDVLGWEAKLDLPHMCKDLWKWTTHNPDGYAHDEVETLPKLLAPKAPAHASSSRVPTNGLLSQQYVLTSLSCSEL